MNSNKSYKSTIAINVSHKFKDGDVAVLAFPKIDNPPTYTVLDLKLRKDDIIECVYILRREDMNIKTIEYNQETFDAYYELKA